MKKGYILSIGAGENQIPLIEAINKMHYASISCDLNANAPGKKISEIFLNISTHKPDLIIQAILALKIEIKAVLTRSTGIPVVTTSKIAEYFGLTALSSQIAQTLINKSRFIKEMNRLNIQSPILYEYKDKMDINRIIFPVFVKPSQTNISHAAMQKCHNIHSLKKACSAASIVSDNNQINIEEYLLGTDLVSIDYVFNDEIIHILTLGEISTGEPHFDGIGWYSCEKNGKEDSLLQSKFSSIKNNLQIKNGFFQSAMKTDLAKNKASVYEIHAEIGGDLVNDIFIPSITDNYDIFINCILLSLNQKPVHCDDAIKPSVIFFKEQLKHYLIDYNHPLISTKIDNKKHIMLLFNNYLDLQTYLKDLSLNQNFSINNNEH